jgi:uncharacterized phage-associated protein
MSFSPSTIANYFLERARAEGQPLTPMQVIKLVYIAHGWHWGYFNSALINEPVEAWKFGPVIPSLYQDLKCYGSGFVQSSLRTPLGEEEALVHSNDTLALLDHVWRRYNRFNGLQLSTLTHEPNTPWARSYSPNLWGSEVIPEQYIADHYRHKIQTGQ